MLTSNALGQSTKTNCIFLRGTSFEEASSILDFIYDGEALVRKNRLNQFLAVAEDLKIQGLSSVNTSQNNNKNYKEKENSQIGNSFLLNGMDNPPCTFHLPSSSTQLTINQFEFQSNDNTSPELEDLQKNTLNLHEDISLSKFHLQKYQTVDDTNTKAGITRQLSPHILPCQAIESISIKEEFFDTNDTNSYAYNSGPSITISEDQFGKKRSIVWK
jgi:hypothetical protein